MVDGVADEMNELAEKGRPELRLEPHPAAVDLDAKLSLVEPARERGRLLAQTPKRRLDRLVTERQHAPKQRVITRLEPEHLRNERFVLRLRELDHRGAARSEGGDLPGQHRRALGELLERARARLPVLRELAFEPVTELGDQREPHAGGVALQGVQGSPEEG